MIDNDKLIPVADLVHTYSGRLEHDCTHIHIYLPATKWQSRHHQEGDVFHVLIDTEDAAIADAIKRIHEWKEYWQLKESITQCEIKKYLKKMLGENDKWALMGLLKIYSFQTPNEQAIDHTVLKNDVGFSGHDAEIMSSIAKQLEQRLAERKQRGINPDPTKCLSVKQKALVRKVISKYWRQIYDASDEMKLLKMVKKHLDEERGQTRLELGDE